MNELAIILFFENHPQEEALYRILEKRLMEWENVTVKVSKTQISFSCKYIFACISFPRVKKGVPDHAIVLTFGLEFPLNEQRIWQKTEAYPNRWTHHVLVSKKEEIDEELMMWLSEAYYFNAHKTRRR